MLLPYRYTGRSFDATEKARAGYWALWDMLWRENSLVNNAPTLLCAQMQRDSVVIAGTQSTGSRVNVTATEEKEVLSVTQGHRHCGQPAAGQPEQVHQPQRACAVQLLVAPSERARHGGTLWGERLDTGRTSAALVQVLPAAAVCSTDSEPHGSCQWHGDTSALPTATNTSFTRGPGRQGQPPRPGDTALLRLLVDGTGSMRACCVLPSAGL